MAVLKMFAVLDTKAGAFMSPFCVPATGVAIRSFADAVNQSGHEFGKHPEDYRLGQIGTYDENSGVVVAVHPIEWLGFGTDFVRAHEAVPRIGKVN